jgi:uncharacterized protein (DUF1919 family)
MIYYNMNNIIISNSCVGQFIMKNKSILPWNNPFIGSLIPNDEDYLKLINNFDKYISLPAKLGEAKKDSLFAIQNKNIYYIHREIKTPYPIIDLGDIEIHFIHEKNKEDCLNTFNRRMERMNQIINNEKYKIIFTWSYSEFFNDHTDIQQYINEYFSNKLNNLIIDKYFIGPPEYNNGNINYINIDAWKNIKLTRNSSHVYDFNDQPFSINIFLDNIKFI